MNQDRINQSPADSSGHQTDIGLNMLDVMNLPDDLRKLVNWIMRQKTVTLPEAAAHTGEDEEVVHTQLEALVAQGFVQELKEGETLCYRTRLAPKQRSKLSTNIWENLE
ncbi:ArsR family transcriptional regulator [Coleofasciculus sp. FACHB-1120]|uniref:ArsR family transcriptional regulator n=1 Tax=Coleofasciculus sp. FACHB-1120 TaxID=2692783 RepID=UPI0016830B48|nr:ArsR family transcriptional regulator [Coleofasciculus sp. FACHB-1120]MBD2742227.1 ArsR family transcriptional regulator [Coleofasciculus sp. FACHB-1120]